jgi:tetratricopeptide (TPR) repeat protein
MKMLRDIEVAEVERKALGFGFQDLMEGARSEIGLFNTEADLERIQCLFELAVKSEDEHRIIDALFYYRYIVKIFDEKTTGLTDKSLFQSIKIVLKAMNNIGGICYDLDQKKEALIWFNKILTIDADNEIARENLEILNQEL